MGHHNGTSVGGEGKPGKDHREAQAADSQRGWCPFPAHRAPAQQGWCHMLLNGHFAFTLAKHHSFKRQPSNSFLTSLLPWGMERLGNFCALVIFSLGFPAAAAT